MKTIGILCSALIVAFGVSLAQAKPLTPDEIQAVLDAHPEIILNVLQQNKKAFFDIVKDAAREDQMRQQQAEEETEKKDLEDSFKNPKKPAIDASSLIRGNKNAKYTLVEYADFQCPYCSRVIPTVDALRKEYGDNLRLIFKVMPLVSIHPQAMPSAEYFEAIAMQSQKKAWAFHDTLFANQEKLGDDFYKATAKSLGVDMAKLDQDVHSQAVADRIQANTDEFRNFGFNGTPGFLLNGIPVRGAYPQDYFENIFKRLASGNGANGSKG